MDLYDEKFGDFEVKYWSEGGETHAAIYRHGKKVLFFDRHASGDLADAFEAIAKRLSGKEDAE